VYVILVGSRLQVKAPNPAEAANPAEAGVADKTKKKEKEPRAKSKRLQKRKVSYLHACTCVVTCSRNRVDTRAIFSPVILCTSSSFVTLAGERFKPRRGRRCRQKKKKEKEPRAKSKRLQKRKVSYLHACTCVVTCSRNCVTTRVHQRLTVETVETVETLYLSCSPTIPMPILTFVLTPLFM